MLPASLEDICDIYHYSGPEADASDRPYLLIEVPHGATRLGHLTKLEGRLRAAKDPRNTLFFLANTDQGAPEYAAWLAETLCHPTNLAALAPDPQAAQRFKNLAARIKVVVIRALIPRTLVDVNRTWEGDTASAGLTGVTGAHLTAPEDLAILKEVHGGKPLPVGMWLRRFGA